ncbi:MAG: caspase family protein, partial [Acidobacteria bacterium]|nr:caspase family protein [Acidobacteriota bacterium]
MGLGVLALILTPAWIMLRDVGPSAVLGSRSVNPASVIESEAQEEFDPKQSAALFVGVEHFSKDKELPDVPFAVDDAVDLAFTFALDPHVRLVDPSQVILALAGTPQKEESKRKLNELIAAGAVERPASQEEIVQALKGQAGRVGHGGIFIASFATHGFSEKGVMLMLASDSVHENHETTIDDATVKDVAATAAGHLSHLLFDACREPEARGPNGGYGGPLSPAPLIDAMTHTNGQVSLYAAAAGKFAYDDADRRNGVFTAAVIDGLQCSPEVDDRGLITADTLRRHVEKQVRAWVQAHRDASLGSAIQSNLDGQASDMPLAIGPRTSRSVGLQVVNRSPQPSSFPSTQVSRVNVDGSSFTVIGDDGKALWTHQVKGTITHAEVGDLDGDERNEVVVSVGGVGEDRGKLMAFRPDGSPFWVVDTDAVPNYEGSTGRMVVKTFKIGDLFRKHRGEIVALSIDEDGRSSRLSIFECSGQFLSGYSHPGPLQDLLIVRRGSYFTPKIVVFGLNDGLKETLPASRPVSS